MTVTPHEGFWRSRESAMFVRYIERQRRRYEEMLEKMVLKQGGQHLPRPWLREQLRNWRDNGHQWALESAVRQYNRKEHGDG